MNKKYYKGHIIKKRWSQVFLKDHNIINSIIHKINLQKNQTIIEIGPGLGALTQPILNFVDSLIVIERDMQLSHKLLKIFGNKKLKIFNQDVMTINFNHLLNQPTDKIRLIGNLPYNIATKLIIYLLKYTNIIYDMHFMLQKEVGACITAQPSNKNYKRLSILMQYHYQVNELLQIPSTSFFPIPKVKSVMIKFIPYGEHNPYPPVDTELLSKLTQFAFHKRRKIIRNSLSTFLNTKKMIQHGIDINARAENLTIQQFCILTKLL